MKRKTFKYPPATAERLMLNESAVLSEPTLQINVRAAKDQLSSLLDRASRGDEVVITSDGRPKAKLVAVTPRRKAFRMHWSWVRSQPESVGASAERVLREERDGRP